jgi:hypothetical protein
MENIQDQFKEVTEFIYRMQNGKEEVQTNTLNNCLEVS